MGACNLPRDDPIDRCAGRADDGCIPPQPWPEELSALGIHDRIGYYHAVRSFPPRDPVAAIELARRRRGARGGTPSPDGPSRPSRR